MFVNIEQMETFSYLIFKDHSLLVLSPPTTFKLIAIFEIYQPEFFSDVYGRMSNTHKPESTSLDNMSWTFVTKN